MFISLSFFFHNKIIKTMNERGNLTKELLSYILQKDSLNFHKRLSIQSLIITNSSPISKYVNTFILFVERKEEGLRGGI